MHAAVSRWEQLPRAARPAMAATSRVLLPHLLCLCVTRMDKSGLGTSGRGELDRKRASAWLVVGRERFYGLVCQQPAAWRFACDQTVVTLYALEVWRQINNLFILLLFKWQLAGRHDWLNNMPIHCFLCLSYVKKQKLRTLCTVGFLCMYKLNVFLFNMNNYVTPQFL